MRTRARSAGKWRFRRCSSTTNGQRREDAGFSCVLGNPPWDKVKPERDGFYLAYEPLIRQFQGTAKNRRIEEIHREDPRIGAAWDQYESQTKALVGALLDTGIYAHQTAIVEEEVEGDDGEPVIKRKTTGGDPDCFKFFLERAWQLTASGRTIGMVMSSSLHNGQGATGLRRLLLDQCRVKAFVKFDNELRVFPGVHNQFKFDIVVFDKGGTSSEVDAAFFSRETEQALHQFRGHRAYLRIPAAQIRRLSPQALTFFEFRNQQDVELVEKAYRLHPTFGEGLMPRLGLKYRCEFHMGNMVYLFRTREWLRRHGCTQEPGEQWRAAEAEWYRTRDYIERPIAQWHVLFDGPKVVDCRVPWNVKSKKAVRESDLNDFDVRLALPDGQRLFAKGPDDNGHPSVFVPVDEARDSDLPAYIPAAKKLNDYTIGPAIRPDDIFLPLIEAKWIHQFRDRAFAYVSGGGSWVVTRHIGADEAQHVPHYFLARLDSETRTPRNASIVKAAIRDVAKTTDERTAISAAIPSRFPCNDMTPTFWSELASADEMCATVAYLASFVGDYFARFGSGRQKLSAIRPRPTPVESLLSNESLRCVALRLSGVIGELDDSPLEHCSKRLRCEA